MNWRSRVTSLVFGLVGTGLAIVLGWVIVNVFDDAVEAFIIRPMVKVKSDSDTPPLYKYLDERYMKVQTSQAEVDPSEKTVNQIQKSLGELSESVAEFHPTELERKVKGVRLYLSTVEGEQRQIVLNGNDAHLSKYIRYGAFYGVSAAAEALDKQEAPPLRAVLRSLESPGQRTSAAIGRIPETEFDRLGGRTLGYVDADIHLLAVPPSAP